MSASERLTTVVSTKGQVILPKTVREHRNWPAGTKLVVEEVGEGVLLKRAPLFEATQMTDVFGRLTTDGRARTVEEMNAAVIAEARNHAGD
jgi:AbrB family looped-hinge helix DNA binding protein